ncbi:MAG: hypothetical protein O9328_03840 [Rhodobacteraceae bacterium]|nr:hypothetical protein [Paracoccaceae bacterium]
MLSLYRRFVFRFRRNFSSAMRARRTDDFIRAMKLSGGERIIDLGGAPASWRSIPFKLKIVIVNLPGAVQRDPDSHH